MSQTFANYKLTYLGVPLTACCEVFQHDPEIGGGFHVKINEVLLDGWEIFDLLDDHKLCCIAAKIEKGEYEHQTSEP